MPYKKRGLHMFNDWEPDDQFNPEVDRLLVTTQWGDVIVVRSLPDGEEGQLNPIIDPDFMPDNLAQLPHELRQHRTLPLNWDPAAFPWFVLLYDGQMSSNGPFIEMEAVGTGWTRSITTVVTIDDIRLIRKDEISPDQVSDCFRGLHFDEFNVREAIMYNEAFRN